MSKSAIRMLVVWCPDWSAVASGIALSQPIAVINANRVVGSSPNARREGVRIGMRRREAQSRCPELQLVTYDEQRDVKAFESVVATVEALAPRVEILQPGICAVPTLGPSRYFGGDDPLVQHVTMMVNEAMRNGGLEARAGVGIADGVFAATLAAHAAMVVPEGESATFLAPQPVATLERPELVDLLRRLGVRTLGDFAALPAKDVLGRFGHTGSNAHLQAQGYDEQPFQARVPPLELAVHSTLEEPIAQLDTATFVAKALADELHANLGYHGLACNRLVIEADMESGDSLSRIWRHDGRLSPVAIAERLRWQMEGWLTRTQGERDEDLTGGIVRLRLIPEGLLPDNGRQLGFWGGDVDAEERASRALARVQGLIGEAGVVTAVVGGGRSPADRITFVPWGTAREAKRSAEQPWPGALPTPSPATVYDVWPSAMVNDASGQLVAVDGRGIISAPPAVVSIEGDGPMPVTGWAGPWLLDERWWDALTARRRARMQVTTEAGYAYLLALEKQRWWVEARYD